MRDSDLARQISDLDVQIAETELFILQKQKRVENLLARGAVTTQLAAEIETLSNILTHLEGRRERLRKQGAAT